MRYFILTMNGKLTVKYKKEDSKAKTEIMLNEHSNL